MPAAVIAPARAPAISSVITASLRLDAALEKYAATRPSSAIPSASGRGLSRIQTSHSGAGGRPRHVRGRGRQLREQRERGYQVLVQGIGQDVGGVRASRVTIRSGAGGVLEPACGIGRFSEDSGGSPVDPSRPTSSAVPEPSASVLERNLASLRVGSGGLADRVRAAEPRRDIEFALGDDGLLTGSCEDRVGPAHDTGEPAQAGRGGPASGGARRSGQGGAGRRARGSRWGTTSGRSSSARGRPRSWSSSSPIWACSARCSRGRTAPTGSARPWCGSSTTRRTGSRSRSCSRAARGWCRWASSRSITRPARAGLGDQALALSAALAETIRSIRTAVITDARAGRRDDPQPADEHGPLRRVGGHRAPARDRGGPALDHRQRGPERAAEPAHARRAGRARPIRDHRGADDAEAHARHGHQAPFRDGARLPRDQQAVLRGADRAGTSRA